MYWWLCFFTFLFVLIIFMRKFIVGHFIRLFAIFLNKTVFGRVVNTSIRSESLIMVPFGAVVFRFSRINIMCAPIRILISRRCWRSRIVWMRVIGSVWWLIIAWMIVANGLMRLIFPYWLWIRIEMSGTSFIVVVVFEPTGWHDSALNNGSAKVYLIIKNGWEYII